MQNNVIKFLVIILSTLSAICLVVISIIYLAERQNVSQLNEILSQPDSTYCIIIDKGYLRRRVSCKYSFNVDGTTYYGKGYCGGDIRVGELYKVVYSLSDPNKHVIHFEYPKLNPNGVIDSVCCEVINLDSYDVRYVYKIDNVEYKRFQRILGIHTYYSIGESYKLYYVRSEPQSSYITDENCID